MRNARPYTLDSARFASVGMSPDSFVEHIGYFLGLPCIQYTSKYDLQKRPVKPPACRYSERICTSLGRRTCLRWESELILVVFLAIGFMGNVHRLPRSMLSRSLFLRSVPQKVKPCVFIGMFIVCGPTLLHDDIHQGCAKSVSSIANTYGRVPKIHAPFRKNYRFAEF